MAPAHLMHLILFNGRVKQTKLIHQKDVCIYINTIYNIYNISVTCLLMLVDARWAGLHASETTDLLGFLYTTISRVYT